MDFLRRRGGLFIDYRSIAGRLQLIAYSREEYPNKYMNKSESKIYGKNIVSLPDLSKYWKYPTTIKKRIKIPSLLELYVLKSRESRKYISCTHFWLELI
jgi:hypothetical protein